MNLLRVTIFIASSIFSLTVFSLEKNEMVFQPSSGGAEIRLSYKGDIFDSAIDIKSKSQSAPSSAKAVVAFFIDVYAANISGNKNEILNLWLPSERDNISKSMDDESLKQNTSRFKSLSSMKIKAIVEYGAHLICYIELDFGSQGLHTMRFTLSQKEGKYFLANALVGDHFFDKISPHLIKGRFVS